MRSYTSNANPAPDGAGVDIKFELDGVQFEGDGAVSMLDMSEFARLATLGLDTNDAAAGSILADIYLSLLGNTEYQRFRTHVRKHRTDPEVLLAILGDLTGDKVGRPTSRSSDSSDGPPPGQATPRVVSFSRGTVEQVPAGQAKTQEVENPQVVSYG